MTSKKRGLSKNASFLSILNRFREEKFVTKEIKMSADKKTDLGERQ